MFSPATSPADFAAKASSLFANPYWADFTRATPTIISPLDPSKIETVSNDRKAGGWLDAAKRALGSAWTATGVSGVSYAQEVAVTNLAKSGSEAVHAASEAVSSVSGGIKSGFRWAVLIAFGLLLLYTLSVLGPFLPKPAAARA